MTYPGGKGRCYQRLISMMPTHRTFIETHLGSGAVMRAKRPAEITLGIEVDPKVIARWRHKFPEQALILCQDAVAFLRGHAFEGDELVYCDPPYMHSARRQTAIYRHEYTVAQHDDLLSTLLTLPCPVMISGYCTPLYDDRLRDWQRHDFLTQTQRGRRLESIWTNYDAPSILHDFDHIGATFREREAIKRRRGAILRRLASLAQTERNAVVHSILSTYGAAMATTPVRPE